MRPRPCRLREHSLITRLRLHMADPCTKSKSLALAVGRYYMGCKILKRVIWPWPRPFQGRFFFGRVPVTANGRPSAPYIPAPLTLATEQQTTDMDYNVVTPSVLFAGLQTMDARLALLPDVAAPRRADDAVVTTTWSSAQIGIGQSTWCKTTAQPWSTLD